MKKNNPNIIDASIKNSITIIKPNDTDVNLDELQRCLRNVDITFENIHSNYYSSNAAVERIEKRNFIDILKAHIYQKKQNKTKTNAV